MDTLTQQFDTLNVLNIDHFYHTELVLTDTIVKTWILKETESGAFGKLRLVRGKWSFRKLSENFFEPVIDISSFVEKHQADFEAYQKHRDELDSLVESIIAILKMKYHFNCQSTLGWNFNGVFKVTVDKYDVSQIVVEHKRKEILTKEKLLKYLERNLKKIEIEKVAPNKRLQATQVTQANQEIQKRVLEPLTFEQKHNKMLRAGTSHRKYNRDCMFVKRSLATRFYVQACKPMIDQSEDPELVAFRMNRLKL